MECDSVTAALHHYPFICMVQCSHSDSRILIVRPESDPQPAPVADLRRRA